MTTLPKLTIRKIAFTFLALACLTAATASAQNGKPVFHANGIQLDAFGCILENNVETNCLTVNAMSGFLAGEISLSVHLSSADGSSIDGFGDVPLSTLVVSKGSVALNVDVNAIHYVRCDPAPSNCMAYQPAAGTINLVWTINSDFSETTTGTTITRSGNATTRLVGTRTSNFATVTGSVFGLQFPNATGSVGTFNNATITRF